MKTIGIVAEGPRDFELIAAVIDTLTNEENSYQMIQTRIFRRNRPHHTMGRMDEPYKAVLLQRRARQ